MEQPYWCGTNRLFLQQTDRPTSQNQGGVGRARLSIRTRVVPPVENRKDPRAIRTMAASSFAGSSTTSTTTSTTFVLATNIGERVGGSPIDPPTPSRRSASTLTSSNGLSAIPRSRMPLVRQKVLLPTARSARTVLSRRYYQPSRPRAYRGRESGDTNARIACTARRTKRERPCATAVHPHQKGLNT